LALVEQAIKRFGTAADLARRMGVGANTPNEWLHRLRAGGRLSVDKRERLRRLLDIAPGGQIGEVHSGVTLPPGSGKTATALNSLLEVLHPDAPFDEFAGLPPGYRQEYLERAADIEKRLARYAAELQRELDDLKKRLIAEARTPKSRR
jgi:transposase-like protein